MEFSDDAKDLILALLTERDTRLGKMGAEEIKRHPFFASVDWDNLRETTAPMIPKISDETDTSNFDEYDEEPEDSEEDRQISACPAACVRVCVADCASCIAVDKFPQTKFPGYTFRR